MPLKYVNGRGAVNFHRIGTIHSWNVSRIYDVVPAFSIYIQMLQNGAFADINTSRPDSDSDSDNVYSTKIDTDTISGLQKFRKWGPN